MSSLSFPLLLLDEAPQHLHNLLLMVESHIVPKIDCNHVVRGAFCVLSHLMLPQRRQLKYLARLDYHVQLWQLFQLILLASIALRVHIYAHPLQLLLLVLGLQHDLIILHTPPRVNLLSRLQIGLNVGRHQGKVLFASHNSLDIFLGVLVHGRN